MFEGTTAELEENISWYLIYEIISFCISNLPVVHNYLQFQITMALPISKNKKNLLHHTRKTSVLTKMKKKLQMRKPPMRLN